MDEPTSLPPPGSPTVARARLHWLIEQLSDEDAVALWRLLCSWFVTPPAPPPAEPEA